MPGDFVLPLLVIELQEFVNGIVVDIQLCKIQIMGTRQPTYRRFDRAPKPFTAVDDPLEHAHIFAEAGPQEFPVRSFAKPIHVEDKRRVAEAFSYVQPVLEVITYVVATE